MISLRNSLHYPKPIGSSDHLAGNVLRKTVNGKTTVYTYDDANQLMTSTKDGKVTTYKYDAAGRMIQEGAKTYRYGYLDKVMSVQENGADIASFTYHADGQISSANTKIGKETFLWDGLALIGRDATQYVNEPYVTGGNPILSSKDGVMFNDILGNTLGTKSDDKFNPVAMTAFGKTADKSAMFTGKPYIGELGYAFLFRNYRAEQGKWQTSDPLGDPDGWNNLVYCNNTVSLYYDRYGLAVGDIYDSMDKAAIARGNEFNGKSISDNKEYGSTLYKNGDGYSYTDPNKGTTAGVSPSPQPEGSIISGYIHAHAAYDSNYDNDKFSDADKRMMLTIITLMDMLLHRKIKERLLSLTKCPMIRSIQIH